MLKVKFNVHKTLFLINKMIKIITPLNQFFFHIRPECAKFYVRKNKH